MNTEVEQTRCPHCNIAFHVNATQLKAAQGTVRCGICLNLFDAAEHGFQAQPSPPTEHTSDSAEHTTALTETKTPDEPDEIADISDSLEHASNVEGAVSDIDDRHEVEDASSVEPRSPESIEPGSLSLDLDKLAKHLAPARNTKLDANAGGETPLPEPVPSPRQQVTRLLGFFASAVLLAALLLQLLFHYSAHLSLKPGYRPMVELLCNQLGCPVAELRDPSLISVEALSIQKHPSLKKVLTVEAILVNRATYAQPFPDTTLHFMDVRGQTLAQRSFDPGQYLPETMKGIKVMLPSFAYQIRLELLAPDQEAVSYALIVDE